MLDAQVTAQRQAEDRRREQQSQQRANAVATSTTYQPAKVITGNGLPPTTATQDGSAPTSGTTGSNGNGSGACVHTGPGEIAMEVHLANPAYFVECHGGEVSEATITNNTDEGITCIYRYFDGQMPIGQPGQWWIGAHKRDTTGYACGRHGFNAVCFRDSATRNGGSTDRLYSWEK